MLSRNLIAALTAVIALLTLGWWWRSGADVLVEQREPGRDRSTALPPAAPVRPEAGQLTRGEGRPAVDLPGSWPGFRGPNRDAVAANAPPLAKSWGAAGPPVQWSIEVGEGYAGPAVHRGRVYLMDYDRAAQADALRCLSLADGREIWRYSYPVPVKRNHGMSRTVPAVNDRWVVAMGPKCHVICLAADTGEFRWAVDPVREYQATVPPWYAGQCPLLDGDRVILGIGGSALMIAVDAATGQVAWRTPNPRAWQMSHSSVMAMTEGERKMYVYCAAGGVAGVAPEDGALLWSTDVWKISIATVPSPVALGDGRVFCAGGYNAGSMMLHLEQREGVITPKPLFRLSPEVFGAPQQTPIFYQGHLYGVRPDEELVCLASDGTVKWASGPTHRFGLGPYMVADGALWVINDSGVLTVAEATPAGYHQVAQAKVLPGHDAWGPLALAGSQLLVRDFTRLTCLDLSVK